MKKISTVLLALGLLVGCSSTSIQTDYSQEADFSAYRTFRYQDSDVTVAAVSPFAHQRIVAAIRREMVASGLTETEDDPDLVVTYYGSSTQQVQFRTVYTGWSTSRRSHWGMVGGMTSATTTTSTFEQGTMVVDIWEPDTNKAVWRGVIEKTLSSNPDTNATNIDRAITNLFRMFPPS